MADEFLGFIESRLRIAKTGDGNQALCDFRAVGAKQSLALFEGSIQQLLGLVELSQILVDDSESLINFRLGPGIAGQSMCFLHSAIYKRDDAQVVGWPHRF